MKHFESIINRLTVSGKNEKVYAYIFYIMYLRLQADEKKVNNKSNYSTISESFNFNRELW